MSSTTYRVGIIGCGGIARAHARGYAKVPATQLVAGADPDASQQSKFKTSFPGLTMYKDYREMLDKENLDLVSVCTWPPLHAEMVIAAAEHSPKGIVCEKPMALNLGEVDQMLEACDLHNVKLIVGHQRRFDQRYVEAKEALKRGEIGELVAVYGSSGGDLLTCGTHTIDLLRFFADDQPIKWVMGQIQRQKWGRIGFSTKVYGHEAEQAAVGRFEFANGVRGLMEQGEITLGGSTPWRRHWFVTLEGTEGRIEVDGDPERGGPPSGWRIRRSGEKEWEVHLIENPLNAIAREIAELIRWIEEGGDHLLCGSSARADTEVLMAIYESARRRGRVNLPLKVFDNPLIAMVEAGEI
jgi:predicted dehydrogenase